MKSSKADYVKLSVRSVRSLHDDEASSRRPRVIQGPFVTTWVFHFETKAQGAAALVRAQGKRTELQRNNPDVSKDAFRLSTFRTGSIRGVPGIGYVSSLESESPDLQVAS